jgi:hypothetical protein
MYSGRIGTTDFTLYRPGELMSSGIIVTTAEMTAALGVSKVRLNELARKGKIQRLPLPGRVPINALVGTSWRAPAAGYCCAQFLKFRKQFRAFFLVSESGVWLKESTGYRFDRNPGFLLRFLPGGRGPNGWPRDPKPSAPRRRGWWFDPTALLQFSPV